MKNKVTTIGGLPTPVFYPSVSSVSKNVWDVSDHVELLVAVNFPQFLISCFDVHKEKNNTRLISALKNSGEQNQVVLYDSGIYEVVWAKSKKWNRKKYLRTLRDNRISHAFALDDYIVSKRSSITTEKLVNDIALTSNQIGNDIISPIIHCKNIDEYINVCVNTSKLIKPRLLAIPERELGFGIVEIARNIGLIRQALNTLDEYQQLHILGTGNPLSMMIYAFMGADSFDGLDWCQTVVDYESATLHHTLHFDLYAHQGRWCNESDMSFLSRCFLHNLDFYTVWMEDVQNCILSNQQEAMINKYIKKPLRKIFLDLLNSNRNFVGG